ncbi:RHS repeat domain-containing protein, partial [Pseudomonas syringae]|uniref:RHS repeat domain-containing protein n=1 Tax=Pseudomonas syringae TaxID=317 RepID=UPI00217F093D
VESTSSYQYDSLGRRVGKRWEIKGRTGHRLFLWQGLRLLREESPGQSSLYLYEPGSYAPLARIDEKEGEVENKVYYFHTDQIGTPLEMTDAEGQIVWQAKYRPWGAIEKLVVNEVEQNLRFQGQYFDVETGLHYNTFRYYDPEIGRFITQDPIGLSGGDNLYQYAPNPNGWVDPIGWIPLSNPISLGHHMVPHAAATKLGIAPFNSIHNVPSMYWLEPGQWNRIEHSSMHGYNGVGANTRPLLDAEVIRRKGLSNDDWLKSLEAHYNNPELASQREDLRIIEGGKPGKIIAKNVSPAQAWEATKKWAHSKGFSMGGCS